MVGQGRKGKAPSPPLLVAGSLVAAPGVGRGGPPLGSLQPGSLQGDPRLALGAQCLHPLVSPGAAAAPNPKVLDPQSQPPTPTLAPLGTAGLGLPSSRSPVGRGVGVNRELCLGRKRRWGPGWGSPKAVGRLLGSCPAPGPDSPRLARESCRSPSHSAPRHQAVGPIIQP